MNLKKLEEYIDDNRFHLSFETDGVGMTWGVSYIRLVIGKVDEFEDLEHFFFSSVKSDRSMTSIIHGGPTWEERADLKE